MKNNLKIALLMQGGLGWLGGSEYIKNLVLALASLPEKERSTFELHLIVSQHLEGELLERISPHIVKQHVLDTDLPPITLWQRAHGLIKRRFFNQPYTGRLNELLKKYEFDFAYPFLTAEENTKCRSAAWIPDFQHKYLPQFFSPEEIESRDRTFASTAKHASTVILSSKSAAEDFTKFFPNEAHKVKILSFKTSPAAAWYDDNPKSVQQNYCLPDRFFLVSNQFWQHKNHSIIFEALKLLKAKSITPTVVCTGHLYDYRNPDYSNFILKSVHQAGLAHQVYLLGLIPKLDQIQLMRQSLAVIQPSLFEGWSTLVEDARALGKVMILSDLQVNIEQDPPQSIFFDRNSSSHLATLLQEIWEVRSSGPDLHAEEQARAKNVEEVRQYGRRFLEIVAEGKSSGG
jgi:glycosyltransferase involved in cell wall biosynthesis